MFSSGDSLDKICARLFSEQAFQRRFLMWDNVKTRQFSSAALESLLTSPTISGRGLYLGECTVANTYTVVFTVNGINLSKDLAQRTIQIEVSPPTYTGNWLGEVVRFVNAHRVQIFEDIAGYFKRPERKLDSYSRWGSWEKQVLSRLPVDLDVIHELKTLILQRQRFVDADQELAEMFQDAVAEWVKDQVGDDSESHLIPNRVLSEILNDVTGRKDNQQSTTTQIAQMIKEGSVYAISGIQEQETRTVSRGMPPMAPSPHRVRTS